MRRSVAAVFTAGLTLSLLAGCSNDSGDSADQSASPRQSTTADSPSASAQSTDNTTAPGGIDHLRTDCAGLTSDDLAQIFGTDFGNPVPSTGGRSTVDDINYRTVGCSFESSDLTSDDTSIEVDLALSFAEQFSDNTVHCIEPSDHVHPVTPVSGLGDQAWWQSDDFENSTDAEGELTVCVDEALIGIEIEGPQELRATAQAQAIEIARIVVG